MTDEHRAEPEERRLPFRDAAAAAAAASRRPMTVLRPLSASIFRACGALDAVRRHAPTSLPQVRAANNMRSLLSHMVYTASLCRSVHDHYTVGDLNNIMATDCAQPADRHIVFVVQRLLVLGFNGALTTYMLYSLLGTAAFVAVGLTALIVGCSFLTSLLTKHMVEVIPARRPPHYPADPEFLRKHLISGTSC